MPPIPTTTIARPTVILTPQARVLKALMPSDPTDHWIDWPLYTRFKLAKRVGWNPTTGTLNRALHGIHAGSSCGAPHAGLLERGLVKLTMLDADGIMEANYRITAAGIKELQRYLAFRKLPKQRDKASCVNDRYS